MNRPLILLLGLVLGIALLLSACETPIDAGNQSLESEDQTPHIEEVKNETPPLTQQSAPVPAPPPSPPAPEPSPPVQPVQPVPPLPSPAIEEKIKVPETTGSTQGTLKQTASAASGSTPGPQTPQSIPILQDPAYTAPLVPDALKLIARTDEKVKNYEFYYAPPPDNIPRDHYFIKGTQVKVELFEQGWFNPDTHKTAVYMDTTTKTAMGYCEDNRLTHCPDPDRQFPILYDTHLIKTPYQWLKDIQFGKLTEGEKISDRITKKISYVRSNAFYEQWLDTYSGLPVRVRITNATGSYTYGFNHLNINSVTNDVFIHATN